MAYMATTPWQYQTWGTAPWPDKYTRLSQRRIAGGTETGTINPFLTDIARGLTLIYINGKIEATVYPWWAYARNYRCPSSNPYCSRVRRLRNTGGINE
jgi:hypothetical protein